MLRFFGTAVLAALIAVLVLEPPPGLSGGLCVSAARREVDVNGESMDGNDRYLYCMHRSLSQFLLLVYSFLVRFS